MYKAIADRIRIKKKDGTSYGNWIKDASKTYQVRGTSMQQKFKRKTLELLTTNSFQVSFSTKMI